MAADVRSQPMPAPTVNDAGQKIIYGTNQQGVAWNPTTHEWEEHRITGLVPVTQTFYQDRQFADKSVTQGGYYYDRAGIPEKGFEEPKPYVPSEFAADRPRVGVGGGLNRSFVEGEVDPNKQADDPHMRKRKAPKWPFMYLQGVK